MKNLGIFVGVIILSYLTSSFFGKIYDKLFPTVTGGFLNFSPVIGLPLAYILLLTFMYTLIGGNRKYLLISILAAPALLFQLYFDSQHLYFFIFLALIGWGIGYGLNYFYIKFKPKPAANINRP